MDACCSERTTATDDNTATSPSTSTTMSRKEKRKLLKKEKRKQIRKEIAVREKEEEEARLNDAEEQRKLRQIEQEELDRMERDRREFDERERSFLETLELNRKREQEVYEQEQERLRLADQFRAKQAEVEKLEETEQGSDWEYVEEGPAEIIWQGNEIIVKKKRVKVPKNNLEQKKEDLPRPISNPLAPQYEAFEDYKSAQQILDTVSQQVPNFGTEQDKAHCPFHLKTGACRFGTRCSRVHFYPDKSCTLLMKNMYAGPGLVWEQDEGLEHTDEEIERSFEEFYEDVHTEFLKFGEIVNFKVCRNGSPHLRGNVYVHYKSLESAVLAYRLTNGRYFAGKQVGCEFVNLTRWKVAICGEFMKSRLKTCSRGTSCNFIHCFRNPGGDYEWADWDRPPPRYWIKKMGSLFGYECGYKQLVEESPDKSRSSLKSVCTDADSNRRHLRSRELDSRHSRNYDDYDCRNSNGRKWRQTPEERENSLDRDRNEEKMHGEENDNIRDKSCNVYSDDDQSDRQLRKVYYEGYNLHKKSRHRSNRYHSKDRSPETDSDRDYSDNGKERYHKDSRSHTSKRHSDRKSHEHDSDRERSVKHGKKKHHEDRASARQKARDSFKGFKEETRQNDKHQKYRSRSDKDQGDDLDSSSSDSHGDTMVKNREGLDLKRKKSSVRSNNALDCSDNDLAGDGFEGNENENHRHRKESSNTKTSSKKTDVSEHSHGSQRENIHGKRGSSKHRKREEDHHQKSERRSSKHRHHRIDRAISNVTLADKEEGSERTHKCRKESLWDQDTVVTTQEGHNDEREVHKESKIDGNFSRQADSDGLEIVNEHAFRCAALAKLQEKQFQKQPTPKTSSHNVEGLATISQVNDDQNDIEPGPRKRQRI